MDFPFLTEIFFIISLLAFLIAMFIILPTLINDRKGKGHRKKKETPLAHRIEGGKKMKYAIVRLKQ
ncbi:hypothetical protein [Allomuricauda sp. SCSIO 65647]|uniref:hypothetical protein n=1 Tax=Allomuricauda sp. SCSIO 65647 TaxID=2908843 RepID=UPI001F292048|nr:hypothetical protein [Muricauda sp. SCSIO 65647]UJH69155.1 hypothetical protein L0P89_08050 [Muricauda sp. SCSIO 65647]